VYTPLIYEALPLSRVKNKKLHIGEGPFSLLRLKASLKPNKLPPIIKAAFRL